MRAATTGAAIEGCLDVWEELALVFCNGARAEATELARYLDLREQQSKADARLPLITSDLESAKSALARASDELAATQQYKKGAGFFISVLLMLGGLALFLWLWWAAILVFLVGLVALAVDATRHSEDVKRAREGLAEREAAVGQAAAAHEALDAERSRIRGEINSIQPRKSVRAVGRVYFPASVTTVNGQPVAIDQSGATPPKRFRLANFSFDSVELQQLVAKIDELRDPPVLLTPDQAPSADSGRMDELHGEERLLRETVEAFSAFVGRVPISETVLPLIGNTTSIAGELSQGVSETELFPGEVLRDSASDDRAGYVQRLNATLSNSKALGVGPKIELLHAYQNIASLLEKYRSLRSTSMASLHSQFMDAMSRSSWCNVRYYCPKSTRNPIWILNRLGIEIEFAHDANQAEVMDRLLGDQEISARIAEDPMLTKKLEQAWRGLQNVRADVGRHQQAAQSAATSVGVAQSPSATTLSGALRYLQSQQVQYIEEYRIALNKIIFGQRTPLVEFSSQPRLRYDPATGVCTNEVAGTEYSNLDEIACSRVLRIHEELLHPMWRHLWTEKADFRRSELFRTNESMLRMSEKESEKLISIGNQFRDDMRLTREVLKQVESELDGKVQQLRGTRQALSQLGLLDPEQSRMLGDESLAALTGGGGGTLLRAEEKETLLALEPQAQTERRELAADPIDVISSPSNLFAESPPEQFRRKLLPIESTDPPPAPSIRRLADDDGAGA